DLIEQRLKDVVVAPVDQENLGIGVAQRVRSRDPGKAAAHDDDTLTLRGRHVHANPALVRTDLPQNGPHRITPSIRHSTSEHRIRTFCCVHPYAASWACQPTFRFSCCAALTATRARMPA